MLGIVWDHWWYLSFTLYRNKMTCSTTRGISLNGILILKKKKHPQMNFLSFVDFGSFPPISCCVQNRWTPAFIPLTKPYFHPFPPPHPKSAVIRTVLFLISFEPPCDFLYSQHQGNQAECKSGESESSAELRWNVWPHHVRASRRLQAGEKQHTDWDRTLKVMLFRRIKVKEAD